MTPFVVSISVPFIFSCSATNVVLCYIASEVKSARPSVHPSVCPSVNALSFVSAP